MTPQITSQRLRERARDQARGEQRRYPAGLVDPHGHDGIDVAQHGKQVDVPGAKRLGPDPLMVGEPVPEDVEPLDGLLNGSASRSARAFRMVTSRCPTVSHMAPVASVFHKYSATAASWSPATAWRYPSNRGALTQRMRAAETALAL
ncbi:MAG: hypothetical protein ACRDTF_04035 [Pseudonocardiaceae bacterium]